MQNASWKIGACSDAEDKFGKAGCPMFAKPVEVAYFSRSYGDVMFDRSNLRDFTPTGSALEGMDLSENMENWVEEEDNGRDGMSISPIIMALNRRKIRTDAGAIITYRNNLNKIMNTPYNTNEPWKIKVERKNGLYFLGIEKYQDPRVDPAEENSPTRKKMCFGGYHFEHLSTSAPAGAAVSDKIDNNSQFCSIIKLKIATKHRVFVGAEIDCRDINAREKTSPGNYVEVKTTKPIDTPRDQDSFERHKLRKWWCQSYLAGVPRIYVGYRGEVLAFWA
jgi:RAT1-interacting protein